ncbi:MAG: hypothetical protein ACE5OR_12745 [bacterium]
MRSRQTIISLFLTITLLLTLRVGKSSCAWQQHVAYTIHVSLDTKEDKLTGHEVLRYTNNSPDTLREVFFHLYQNAFGPG